MNLTSLPNIHIEQEYHTPEEKKSFWRNKHKE